MSLQLLRIATGGKKPIPSEILEGQLALNLVDKTIWTKDHDGNVVQLAYDPVELVNTLTETAAGKALDARQGRALKIMIDNINTLLTSDDATLDDIQEIVDYIKANKADLENLSISNIAGLQNALNGKEDAFTKNSAFNKNFGTGNNDVARGDHSHDEGYFTGEDV